MSVTCTRFLGLEFTTLKGGDVLEWILARLQAPEFTYLVTPNVDHIVQITEDRSGEVAAAYRTADLTVCDSRILSHLAKISGLELQTTPGSDLTSELLAQLPPATRVAVIGGTASTEPKLQSVFPNLIWTVYQPPMGLRHDVGARETIVRFVGSSDAEIFLFCVGAPQSELTCATIKRQVRASGVALCVGASLEFLTGEKIRAPLWMQRISMEWLFRLLTEPRRLWRRYLVAGPRIFIVWHRWQRRQNLNRS